MRSSPKVNTTLNLNYKLNPTAIVAAGGWHHPHILGENTHSGEVEHGAVFFKIYKYLYKKNKRQFSINWYYIEIDEESMKNLAWIEYLKDREKGGGNE